MSVHQKQHIRVHLEGEMVVLEIVGQGALTIAPEDAEKIGDALKAQAREAKGRRIIASGNRAN